MKLAVIQDMKRFIAGRLGFAVLWCLVFCSRLDALPDLFIKSSDIQFSKGSPETTETFTITAIIHNSGGAYHDQVVSTPIAQYDTFTGMNTDITSIYADNSPPPLWMAQKYVSMENAHVSQVHFKLMDQGQSDEIVLEVRSNNPVSPPVPGTGPNNLIASVSVDSVFSSTDDWQSFIPSGPLSFSASTTYWFCLENFNVSSVDGYGIRRDSGTATNEVAFSGNLGTSWVDSVVSGNGFRKLYHRVYRSQDTVIRIYQGDPDAGGTLISVSTISLPITAGGSTAVSTTWSVSTAGTYDIYVQVDGAGLINESNEINNKAFRSITVLQISPKISESSPPDGARGADPNGVLSFTFNKAMNASTLSGAFSMKAVRNASGQSVSETVSGSLTYDSSSRKASFEPAESLKRNYKYDTQWISSAQDTLGFSLSPKTVIFETAIRNNALNTIFSSDQTTQVVLEPGAVSSTEYYVELDVSPSITSAVSAANDKAAGDRDAFTTPLISSLRRIRLFEGVYPGHEVTSPQFSGDVTVTIPYTDNGGGFVAGTQPPVKEENLSMYWLNESDGLWVRLPDSQVDAARNTVSARVPHFSHFVLMGLNASDLSRAYAYPVPFRPNAGLGHTKVKFTGLSPQCVIRIYSVTGELVRTLEEADGDGFNDTWDASDAPSGVYLYIIDNGSQRKTGQLVIVK